METIRVNMNPNPLDVQTIHASQNDGEARQWGFELHNNGDVIDSSEVTDQITFKAYEGGTEQILPTNGSTPTTSPFKGDIKYPQGLLSDQELLYRESPTEEDGLAKITDIKGNTLVWNQLVEKGNMTDGWTFSNSTGSYSNNILTFTATAQGGFIRPNLSQPIISGHKYLGTIDVKGTSEFTSNILFVGRNEGALNSVTVTTEWQTFSKVFTNTVTENNYYPRVSDRRESGWDAVQVKNCMLIDITQLGLDISNPSDFASLFPLPYYAYNQGSLLSFNGNGIKTVSKNQFNTQIVSPSTTVGATLTKGDGSIRLQYTGTGRYTGFNFMNPNGGIVSDWANKLLLKKKYRLSFDFGGAEVTWTCGLRTASANSFVGSITMRNQGHYSLTLNLDTMTEDVYISWVRTGNSTNPFDVTVSNIQLELGTTETSYTPFEEQTIGLPISTYFPTGMKSAGTVYDELTPRKAITRIGAVDLGSLEWTYQSANTRFYATIDNMPLKPVRTMTLPNPLYTSLIGGSISSSTDKVIYNGGNERRIYIHDLSYTSAEDFKQAMSGVYLYYELATPTETSFTTASLVTENAEIPLSNEDGVLIGKCAEQLSSESGFFDAKIKLANEDGECYSNKIQLHVERSPQ